MQSADTIGAANGLAYLDIYAYDLTDSNKVWILYADTYKHTLGNWALLLFGVIEFGIVSVWVQLSLNDICNTGYRVEHEALHLTN